MAGEGAQFIDLGSSFWPLRLFRLASASSSVFLLNTTNIFVLSLFFALGLLPRTIVYDHNSSRRFWRNPNAGGLFLFFMRRCFGIRVVHEHLQGDYLRRGLSNVTVESPFIPPNISERAQILESYPDCVLGFLHDNTHYKIASSAWKYNLDSAGNDIYGISSLLELLSKINRTSFRVRCLLAFGEFDIDDFPREVLAKIKDLQTRGDLILMCGQREFWPVYNSIDMFLRLTSTDGESVSILEALYFGCKVLASDVVPRPQGVALYRYGEHEDLENAFVAISGLAGFRSTKNAR